MNDAPKYQPTDDELRIQPIARDGAWFVDPICDSHMTSRADAEAEVQRVAIAIADRVHGAELAALRAAARVAEEHVARLLRERGEVRDQIDMVRRALDLEIGEVKRLRTALEGDKPCNMSVDCEMHGTCYAEANGRPELCGKPAPAERDWDAELAALGDWLWYREAAAAEYWMAVGPRFIVTRRSMIGAATRAALPGVAALVDERNAARKDGA